MSGIFITIEGIDGTGKTTQTNLLEKYFLNCSQEVVRTREPGGTILAEKIRELILSNEYSVSRETETLLIEAARSSHIREVVIPALQQGKIVLCERGIDSTSAYQGYARGVDLEMVDRLNEYASCGVFPILTILFDVNPSVSYTRIKNGDEKSFDRMENEGLGLQKKVREGYLDLAKQNADRIKIINVTGKTIGQVHDEVRNIVDKIICVEGR